MTGKSAKDFYKLFRNIGKLSNGQARIVTWDDEDLTTFQIEIAPSDGLYMHGKFLFKISQGPDGVAPTVFCFTDVYHPNIDTTDNTDSSATNVCVSLLDDWDDSMDMEDLVQAILFLFYQPNLEDPLCPLIEPYMDTEEFGDNVKRALMGEEVEDHDFEANIGYIENGLAKILITENKIENIDSEKSNETTDIFPTKIENEIITDAGKLDLDPQDQTVSTLGEDNTICEQEQNMTNICPEVYNNIKLDNLSETTYECQYKESYNGAQENLVDTKYLHIVTGRNTLLINTQQNLKELDFRTRNSVDNALVTCTFLVASICRHFVRKFVKWKQKFVNRRT